MHRAAGRSVRVAIVGSVASFASVASAAAQQPLARDWNQRCANAANTSSCDVEPVRAPPTEAWRLRLDGVLAGPVVASDRLFAVVRESKERELVAVEPASGKVLGKRPVDKCGDVVSIAAFAGTVVVVEPDHARFFRLASDKIVLERTFDGVFLPDPIVLDGRLLLHHWDPKAEKDAKTSKGGKSGAKENPKAAEATHSTSLDVVDFASGKLVGTIELGRGRSAIVSDEKDHFSAVGLCVDEHGDHSYHDYDVVLRPPPSASRGAAAAWAWSSERVTNAAFANSAILVRVDQGFDHHAYAWFGAKPDADDKPQFRFAAPPVGYDHFLVGFADDGRLLEIDFVEHHFFDLLRGAAFPKGALNGAASCARDVLFLGNWALELGSGRILWCVEGLEPVGPAIPAGDGVLVVTTKSGELVGLVDPKRAAEHAATNAAAPKERPKLPSEDAALAPSLAGDERATFLACCDALAAEQTDALVALFDRYASFKFFDECQRLLDAAKKSGLDPRRRDELTRRIAGQTNSTSDNAPLQRKKLAGDEHAALEKIVERTLAAADWCAQQKLVYAAAGLVRRAGSILPDRPVDAARAAPWMPAAFPWKESNAVQLWLDWADALLPSGAKFVARDDAAWKRVQGTPFERDGIALRSANLLLFSRETTPTVVGACLSRGEAAVRALDGLLGPSPVGLKTSGEPLEIRLHVTRQQYLNDKVGGSDPPMPWSAGVYSPSEGISRFFAEHDADRGDPLGRELHSVLAHELTHHYVDQRWIHGRSAPTLPGMWLVEGVAEFVSEQAVEMGRLGDALDDATVRSLDVAAAMAARKKLLPLSTVLALDEIGFAKKLEGDAREPVELRHSLHQLLVDVRGLFYMESAALSFFALRRAGDVGRKGYVELLQSYYRGERVSEPWKKLGFEDVAALDKAFGEFLAGL